MCWCRSRLFVVAAALIIATLGVDVSLGAGAGAAAVADATAPTVSIILPASGASLSTSSLLDAQASDEVGVTSVEYRLTGGAFSDYPIGYGKLTIYGWIFRWDLSGCPDGFCDPQHSYAVPPGAYTLVAVAFDAAGNAGRSAAIAIGITAALRIVTPSDGAVVRESVPLVVDTGGLLGVTRVGYVEDLGNWFDATRLADGRWSASWKTNALSNGTHWLQAIALNRADEQVGWSPPVAVTTDNDRVAPTSRIVVPSDQATVSGTTILAASASDPSRCVYKQECGVGVTSVRFMLNGGRNQLSVRELGAARLTIYGWVLAWDTTSVPADSYTLTVQASDANGNNASSPGIRVRTTGPALPGVRIVVPAGDGIVKDTILLDADAWGSPNVTRVEFRISGNGRHDVVIGDATKTIYGWLYWWNTASFAGGSSYYDVTAVAYNAVGNTRSAPVRIVVGVFCLLC
jgi:hypothetical protein